MYIKGSVFCTYCNKSIKKEEIPFKTHIDRSGLGKCCCNECGYQVRLRPRHKTKKGKAWRDSRPIECYYPLFTKLYPGEWRKGGVKLDVLHNLEKWEKLIEKPITTRGGRI